MKTRLLTIVVAAFLPVFFINSYAIYNPPVRTLVIPYSPVAVTVDGNDCESYWSAEQSTDAFNMTGCAQYPDTDFTFTFKVCYDIHYLYLFGNVLDDIDNSWDWGLPNSWTYDNFEVYLDLDTNGSGVITAYDTNTIELLFCRGVDSVEFFGRAQRFDYKYFWKNTSTGWLFEVAIPWKCVLGNGQSPEDIMPYFAMANGFDVNGADSDASGPDARDCQTEWDNDDDLNAHSDIPEDGRWNNRTIFGVVTFQNIETVEENDFDPCFFDPIKNYAKDKIANFNLIPDYSGKNLIIENNIAGSTIIITSILGQTLLTAYAETERIDINLSVFQQGNIYLVSVTDKQGNTRVRKFFW
jgi:hypothetical protein